MPELPDIAVYIDCLEGRIVGAPLEKARIVSPFLPRTVAPRPAKAEGRRVAGPRRLGKRIVIGFEGDLFFVIHRMIAGRLHWAKAGAKPPGKRGLAAFDFAAINPAGETVMTYHVAEIVKRRSAESPARGSLETRS